MQMPKKKQKCTLNIHVHHSQWTGNQSHKDDSQSAPELLWELQLSNPHVEL